MSFKLIVVIASLAAVSCARLDNEQMQQQLQQQQEIVQQQNERIRDHQRLEIQQRQEQVRELEDQRRRQEQMIRDHEQQRRDNHRDNEHVFITAQPHFLPASIRYVSIPSSRRNFELRDDSNYNFGYAVSDFTTGDMKSQHETRNGDQVQGQYTMMDSDGYQRIVDYRADDKNGFDAEVRREPTAAVLSAPQLIRIDGTNNYAPLFFHRQHPAAQFVSAHPTIYSSTSVSRRDDGQRSQYLSSTASNF